MGWFVRVVAVMPLYPPKSRVGAWLATHELLAALVARGHHVDVFTRLAGADVYELDGVTVGQGRMTHTIDVAVAVCDVVVSHAGDDRVGVTLAEKWAKPSIRMAHGWNRDLAERLAGADLVVFNSQTLADTAHELGWDGEHIIVWPPLRVERFRTMPGRKVTLVNLSEMKGGELFWRLARSAPHLEFLGVIGGYGRQIRDRLPNVEIVETTENMRDDVYGRTRILLMPSEAESWGLAALEAACSGIPTIAHPTDGLIASLGDAATFVDREDGQGWLDAIEALSDPKQWATKSALARARAEQIAGDDGVERFIQAIEQLGGSHAVSETESQPSQVRGENEGESRVETEEEVTV